MERLLSARWLLCFFKAICYLIVVVFFPYIQSAQVPWTLHSLVLTIMATLCILDLCGIDSTTTSAQ
jgi:predicted membrane-bound mannosyltransferase